MLESGLAGEAELSLLKDEVEAEARRARDIAWKNYTEPIKKEREESAPDY